MKQDEANDFLDTRAWLGMNVKYKNTSAFFALDIAGDDFTDGVLLGNDNPSLPRKWETKVKELYIKWDGPVLMQIGRQQAHLGNGIVAHIKRDSLKVVKKFNRVKLAGVWVKGAEGNTQDRGTQGPSPTKGTQNVNQSGVPINAARGEDDDLDSFALIGAYEFSIGTFELFRAWQVDATAGNRLPQKDFYDANISFAGFDNRLNVTAEFTLLRGTAPSDKTNEGTAVGERPDFEAYMAYFDVSYNFPVGVLGFGFGSGSGDDNPTDKIVRGFQSLFIDETSLRYNNLFADDIWGFDLNGAGSLNQTTNGFNNVTWYKLYAEFPVTYIKGLTVSPSWSVMTPTENPAGTTGDKYGDEFDFNVDYKINRYYSAFLKTAWFEPGDYLSDNLFGGLRRPDAAQKIEAGIEARF